MFFLNKKSRYLFLFFFCFFIFLFLFLNYNVLASDVVPTYSSQVFKYNYDRYNYNYIKYIRFYYYNGYSFNFINFYTEQLSFIYNFKSTVNFFFYKYFFFVEDSYFKKSLVNYFNLINAETLVNEESVILEKYKYSFDVVYMKHYLWNLLNFGKHDFYTNYNLNFLINFKNKPFGSLLEIFTFNSFLAFDFFYFFLILVYYTYIYIFFLILFFILFYYVFLYLFFYKKFFIIGQFFSMFALDTEDNHGGYLDYMEEQEMDLGFADNYYNIVKYEFNYLNYIVYANKFILYWLMNSTFFLKKNINLGQTKYTKFLFFSLFFTKIETNFLSGLTVDDDLCEWSYFPYEHLVTAFPESNFYLSDAVFEYGKVDLAFDFMLNRQNIMRTLIHPLSLLQEELDEELEYDEHFKDIEGFLKNYSYTSKILKTYKLRFKTIYKRLRMNINIIENSVNYSGSLNSDIEIKNRIQSVNFDGFFIDWPYFREIINSYNIKNSNYENFDEELVGQDFLDKEREKLLKQEEDDLLVVQKYRLLSKNIKKTSQVAEDVFSLNTDISFNKNEDYTSYIKVKQDIWKLYASSNFFSIILESSFLQWCIRSKWLWSKFKVPLEYDFLIEDSFLFESDKNLNFFFNSYYKNSNFSENLYKDDALLNVSNSQLFTSFLNLELSSVNSILCPPYKNYLGYLLINPVIRNSRDLYILFSANTLGLRELIFSNKLTIGSFDFLKNNTYIFDTQGLPSGMVLSTNNMFEEDLYSNSNLKEIEQLEVLEEEDVDNVLVKPVYYAISRFVIFTYALPVFIFCSYFLVVLNNLI